MACRGLYVFSHASKLGDAPAHTLFERVNVARSGNGQAPRAFGDYAVDIDDADLPAGVTLTAADVTGGMRRRARYIPE